MLLYLPERLYKVLENDEKYASMVNEVTSDIFGSGDKIDFLKTMFRYENSDEEIKKLQDYIRSVSPKEYQLELELSFNDDLEKFENDFDNMDIESKLYWLCEVNGGDMSYNKEFNLRNNKFIRLYNNYVVHNPSQYSEFLHCMYYMKIVYNKIFEMIEKNQKSIDDINDFFEWEEKLFNDICKLSNLKSFKQIMYSKKIQMMCLLFEFIGQFCDDYKEVNKLFESKMTIDSFKYKDFNYFMFVFYVMCFQQSVDKNNLDSSYYYLNKVIELMNYCFVNKDYAIKSLNHYNNALIDEFLSISKFVYSMVAEYMPILNIRWNILNNMTEVEQRYYNDELSLEEFNQYSKYIKKDKLYSESWCKSVKLMLKTLDKLYS